MAELARAVERTTLPASRISVQFPAEQLFHPDGTPRHRWRAPLEDNPVNGQLAHNASTTSTVRPLSPLPGRALSAGVRFTF